MSKLNALIAELQAQQAAQAQAPDAVTAAQMQAAQVTPQEQVAAATGDVKAVQTKMETMFNAIMPLLYNLQKNPGKEYIYWPDRHNKVEQFRDKLTILYKS